jgi:uncharacterized protein YjdB
MAHLRWIRSATIAVALAALAGCDGGVTDSGRSGVASVAISPSSKSAEVGATVQLEAVVKDANGNSLPGRQVFWASNDTSVAVVSPSGLVIARAPGSAQIAASAERQSGFASIVVVSRAPASVVIQPGSSTLTALSDTVHLTAVARDASGNILTGRTVTWSSSAPGTAAISSAGVATAVANGVASISAKIDGVAGTATLTVAQRVASVAVAPPSVALPLGDSARLSASAVDAKGFPVAGAKIAWGSSNTIVAPVSTTGVVTGSSTGEATITATSEGKTGRASITVVHAAVASVSVSPTSATRQVGQSAQFSAELRDAGGNVLTGRTVTWSSSNPAIATVNSTGVVQALAPGNATITATSEEKSGSATFTVTPVPVASVAVTPQESRIAPGEGVQLTAVLRDANNNVLTGRTVTWTSSNVAVAIVDGNGSVRAVAPGRATITATAEGKSGTASVAVNFGSLSSISVSPASQTAQVGGTLQYRATLKDAAGKLVTGTAVDWSSSAPTIANVNNAGQVRGVTPGSANIVATAEGKSDTAVAVITAGPPASLIKLSGDNQNGNVGQPFASPLVVRVTDAFGNPVPNVRVSWAVLSPNGQVSPSSTTTDAAGRASTTWTLGPGPKNQSAQASVNGLAPVTFSARR